MSVVVVYDACVLFPAPIRDLLVRLGMTGLFQAKWSERILDECFRSILERRPDLTSEKLARTRDLLNHAIPDVLVEGYEPLEAALGGLPDPGDRHVIAAAIHCGAQVIVTLNLKHFPDGVLGRFNIEAQHPDEFVLNVIDLNAARVAEVVRKQAASLRSPPQTPGEVMGRRATPPKRVVITAAGAALGPSSRRGSAAYVRVPARTRRPPGRRTE